MAAGVGERADEATLATLLLAVYVPTALLAFGQGLLIATLPLYAEAMGVSVTLVSLAVSAAAIGTLAADVPAGLFLGRVGLRPAMIGGSALVAVSTAALALTTGFWPMVAARLLAGVGTAIWGLSRHAYIAEAIPAERRGKAVSVFGGVNRLGVFLGPLVGGLLATRHGLSASFLASALLAAAALVVSVVMLKPVPRGAAGLPRGVRWGRVRDLLRADRAGLGAAAAALTMGQMVRAGRFLILPLWGVQQVGLNAAEVGLVITAGSLLDVSMFMPAGYVMDRFGRKVAAVPSFAVLALGVALVPFAHSLATLMLASLVIGLGNGMGSGTMMTLGADLAPPGATGEFLGVWRLVGDTGGALGPIVVGAVAAGLGLAGGAWVLAAIGVAAAAVLGTLVRETKSG